MVVVDGVGAVANDLSLRLLVTVVVDLRRTLHVALLLFVVALVALGLSRAEAGVPWVLVELDFGASEVLDWISTDVELGFVDGEVLCGRQCLNPCCIRVGSMEKLTHQHKALDEVLHLADLGLQYVDALRRHRKVGVEALQHGLVQVSVTSMHNRIHKLLAHVRRVIGFIIGERLSEEVAQDNERDPRHHIVSVASAADAVLVCAAYGLLALEVGWVVGEYLLLGEAHRLLQSLALLVQQRGDDWIENADVILDRRRLVLAGSVDEGFAEDDARADAEGELQPDGWVVRNGALDELPSGEECSLDWVGDHVDLVGLSANTHTVRARV